MPAKISAEKSECSFCRLPRADLECGVCETSICRKCVERLPEETFAHLVTKAENLSHCDYCPNCHDEVIVPALAAYTEILERAKNVGYWARTYRGNVPVIKKALEYVTVAEGFDRDDVLLKMGFMAAELGYNGLIRGELVSRKVRNFGYQKMSWSGKALPCEVDQGKVDREEFREAHWRQLHHR